MINGQRGLPGLLEFSAKGCVAEELIHQQV